MKNPLTVHPLALRVIRRRGESKSSVTIVTFSVLLVGATTVVEARDRPGTPTDVTARSSGATTVSLSWRNTARKDEHVKFEVEPTKDGSPMRISQPEGTSGTGAGWLGSHGYVIRDLQPEAQYCFRVWSRYLDNDVQSAIPSAWACADTPPYPPLAPLDVQANVPFGVKRAFLKWNTPDQSNHRRITSYEIERQSPPGPNRPTLSEGSIPGPDGEQTIRTKLAYSFKSSEIDPNAQHAFRVCAVNNGGRACAKPVVPFVEPPSVKEAQNEAVLQHSTTLGQAKMVPLPSAKQLHLPPEAAAVVPPPPPKILTPAAGSSIEQARLFIQVKPAGSFVASKAEVEFVWQPLSPKPDAMLVASPGLWAVPMSQLVSGVTVPDAAKPQTPGRWIVRVRSADRAPGAWSEAVAFNLIASTASMKPSQEVPTSVRRPAGFAATEISAAPATTPKSTSAQSAPTNVLIRPVQPPGSSLQRSTVQREQRPEK